MVVSGHGLPKRREPADRQIVLSVGVLAKGLHDGLGHGKRRLAQAKLENCLAASDPLGAESLTASEADGDTPRTFRLR